MIFYIDNNFNYIPNKKHKKQINIKNLTIHNIIHNTILIIKYTIIPMKNIFQIILKQITMRYQLIILSIY